MSAALTWTASRTRRFVWRSENEAGHLFKVPFKGITMKLIMDDPVRRRLRGLQRGRRSPVLRGEARESRAGEALAESW